MNRIGRNDPCPCGSGKKYKHCHGALDAPRSKPGYEELRRLEYEAQLALEKLARRKYGAQYVETAWTDFITEFGEDLVDSTLRTSDLFERWMQYCWRHGDGQCLPELFFSGGGSRSDEDVARFIEATYSSPYSFFQVLASRSGQGMDLRDLLQNLDVSVAERAASSQCRPGDILFARVVTLEGISMFMGMGPMLLPATTCDSIIEYREWLEEDVGESPISADTMLELENDHHEEYLEQRNALLHRKIQMCNTDGDPLLFITLTWSIASQGDSFEVLKDLQQTVSEESDEELHAAAREDAGPGDPTLKIHWLKQRTPPSASKEASASRGTIPGDNILYATISIGVDTLTIEVNSERRADEARKMMKQRFGDKAVFLKMEAKSLEQLHTEQPHERTAEELDRERSLNDSPEARALIEEMMRRHWETWPDMPVPALRGMTPRNAARDPLGRELLESLLLDFEQKNAVVEAPLRVDVDALRKTLGMKGRGPRSRGREGGKTATRDYPVQE
ncbi:MAG: SEC-C domain-containing protein [Ignavibacteria bacterium]|nr:SEC-C domain-containing protein [Ignavibacteria bacterium]